MWTSSEARKLDVFSFGMLCLWTLFEKELSELLPTFRVPQSQRSDESTCSVFGQSIATLEAFKVNGDLLLLAQRLLKAVKTLSDDESGALRVFFTSVLDDDQDRRDMSAGNVFKRYALNFRHKLILSVLAKVKNLQKRALFYI